MAIVATWLGACSSFGQEGGGVPAASGTAAVAYWQATAAPQAVVQGGAIPSGWQPQAMPYHGIGPDGKPITVYLAPTYVFTYQSGPPVLAVPAATAPRGVSRSVPGVTPPPTVARYAPTPYQFPADSRALAGTPVVPPATPLPAPPPPAAAPAAAPAMAPPPTQWAAASPPPAAAAPPAATSGDWVTVVPPAVATAALAAGAASADTVAAATTPAAAPAGGTPAQPVSTSLTSPPSAVAAPHLWRVVGVQDGDSITCLDESNQQQKVRLAAIDAPELGQDYGKESRETLAAMVFGKTVEVYDQGRDETGRWIARLVVDGTDVNRQMVVTGNAWHYAAFSTDQSLDALQSQAQSQKLGLWNAATAPTPPWVYRQSSGGS